MSVAKEPSEKSRRSTRGGDKKASVSPGKVATVVKSKVPAVAPKTKAIAKKKVAEKKVAVKKTAKKPAAPVKQAKSGGGVKAKAAAS